MDVTAYMIRQLQALETQATAVAPIPERLDKIEAALARIEATHAKPTPEAAPLKAPAPLPTRNTPAKG